MTKRFFTLIFAIGLASVCAVQAQSPTPGESPAGAASPAKHRTQKKAKTTASPGEAAASSSPAKFSLGDLFKPKSSAAASPAAATGAAAKNRSTEVAANPPAPGGGHGLVWVNTETHVYHREGSRFYGTTKKGKYMTEADAVKEGDKAAKAPGKGQ
jgi:hypothetical protein